MSGERGGLVPLVGITFIGRSDCPLLFRFWLSLFSGSIASDMYLKCRLRRVAGDLKLLVKLKKFVDFLKLGTQLGSSPERI